MQWRKSRSQRLIGIDMEKLKKQDARIIVQNLYHPMDDFYGVEISDIHSGKIFSFSDDIEFADELAEKFLIYESIDDNFICELELDGNTYPRQQLVELLRKEGFENSFLFEDTISEENEGQYYFERVKKFKLKVGDLVFFEKIHSSYATIEAIEPHGKFPIQVQIGDGKWWMDHMGKFEDGGSHGSVEFYSKVDIKSC